MGLIESYFQNAKMHLKKRSIDLYSGIKNIPDGTTSAFSFLKQNRCLAAGMILFFGTPFVARLESEILNHIYKINEETNYIDPSLVMLNPIPGAILIGYGAIKLIQKL